MLKQCFTCFNQIRGGFSAIACCMVLMSLSVLAQSPIGHKVVPSEKLVEEFGLVQRETDIWPENSFVAERRAINQAHAQLLKDKGIGFVIIYDVVEPEPQQGRQDTSFHTMVLAEYEGVFEMLVGRYSSRPASQGFDYINNLVEIIIAQGAKPLQKPQLFCAYPPEFSGECYEVIEEPSLSNWLAGSSHHRDQEKYIGRTQKGQNYLVPEASKPLARRLVIRLPFPPVA